MESDTDFYDLGTADGAPENTPAPNPTPNAQIPSAEDALKEAKRLAEGFPAHGTIYLVRGNKIFAINADAVQVKYDPQTKLRDISINDAKMVRYS